MLALKQKSFFKKCLKKYQHNHKVLNELEKVVGLLVNEQPIPTKYKDHKLKGNYKDLRELHLQPDTLLFYYKIERQCIVLCAIGSHADLFDL